MGKTDGTFSDWRFPLMRQAKEWAEELKKEKDYFPKYICYLSSPKVDNLYSQIADMDISMIKQEKEKEFVGKGEIGTPTLMQLINVGLSFGGRGRNLDFIEGKKNHIQKLREIVSYFQRHGLIQDFNSIGKETTKNQPVLYSITAEFSCNKQYKYDNKYIKVAKIEEEDYCLLLKNSNIPRKMVGDVVTIETGTEKGKLILACSTIFFSDMGCANLSLGSDDPIRTYSIHPHSGNYFFFENEIPATFEALFILNGKKENCWYGSPLVLFNDYSSGILL